MLKAWDWFGAVVQRINVFLGYVAALLIIVSTLAISYEVVWRYLFHQPHDWNLEFNIFILIAATFLAAAHTQMKRGHVGIEVLDSLMSERANRWRYLVGDILSLAFCVFIAWKSWAFFHEAWVDGKMSNTAWGPKLWPAYFFMALGMTLLSLQMIAQIGDQHIHQHREDEE